MPIISPTWKVEIGKHSFETWPKKSVKPPSSKNKLVWIMPVIPDIKEVVGRRTVVRSHPWSKMGDSNSKNS
jgi:hypothetical protein